MIVNVSTTQHARYKKKIIKKLGYLFSLQLNTAFFFKTSDEKGDVKNISWTIAPFISELAPRTVLRKGMSKSFIVIALRGKRGEM